MLEFRGSEGSPAKELFVVIGQIHRLPLASSVLLIVGLAMLVAFVLIVWLIFSRPQEGPAGDGETKDAARAGMSPWAVLLVVMMFGMLLLAGIGGLAFLAYSRARIAREAELRAMERVQRARETELRQKEAAQARQVK